MPALFPLAEVDHELRLAHWLLGRNGNLERRILEALLAEPKRYRDLRGLIRRGRSETPLTRALARLGELGLIRQGMTIEPPGDPRYYALTSLGVLAVLTTHKLRPIAETLDAARRAGMLA
ncbi:MAG: hypothetical protein ACYDDF_03495 [Thermoplasmatota archaeon]